MQKMTDRMGLKGSLLVSSVFTHTRTVSEHPRLSCVWCCNDHVRRHCTAVSDLIQVCGVLVQWLSVHCALHSTVCLRMVSSFKVVDSRYGHITVTVKIMVTFRNVCIHAIQSHNSMAN